jgi:hypothetical protein
MVNIHLARGSLKILLYHKFNFIPGWTSFNYIYFEQTPSESLAWRTNRKYSDAKKLFWNVLQDNIETFDSHYSYIVDQSDAFSRNQISHELRHSYQLQIMEPLTASLIPLTCTHTRTGSNLRLLFFRASPPLGPKSQGQ